VAFYGLGLNSSVILTTIGFGNYTAGADVNTNAYQSIYNSSVGNIILAVGGLIPGYYATMLLVDKWGRKPIQLMGFAMLTAIFICMGR
jgi:PHS family inorganic phosphate transporter-like MFS transporter